MSDKRVLVLGACGFLGSVVTRRLDAAAISVRAFDRNEPSSTLRKLLSSRVEFLTGALEDERVVADALKAVDTILHFIGSTVPATSMENIGADLRGNVLPTLRLLELARDARVKRVVYASSGGTVYGPVERHEPISEQSPTNPVSAYGVSKLVSEKYIQLFTHNFGIRHTILRIANPYGPHQSTDRAQGIVGLFLGKMKRGEPIDVWGDGSAVRDYVFEDDVADALLSVVEQEKLSGVYHVGSGVGISVNEVIAELQKVSALKANVRYLPPRAFDVSYNVLNNQKLVSATGWRPKVAFREGVSKVWASSHLV